MSNITVLSCRWVVPVRPTGVVLDHHSVVVGDSRILAVLPQAEARELYPDAQELLFPTHVMTPGLVNIHTHAAMCLLRGVGDDLPLQRWLGDRIWPLERELVSSDFVYEGTRHAALEMLRSGTTCFNDMYFYPDAAIRAARSFGMRIAAGIIVIEFPSAYASDPDDYLRKGLATRDVFRDDPLVTFTLAPHAPYTVADETLKRVATLAEELDLPVHTHVHETQQEISDSLAQHGMRPLARLEKLGLVSERLIAVHAVHLNDGEIALLAQRGASVAHCPASNLKLASGIARCDELLRAGVNVAIGTDGAASNNRIDMLAEMRLAALLAKGQSGNAAAFSAWQALEAATLAGARALALEDSIGSIEVGKEADLVAFDLGSLETTPSYDPVSTLVYAAGREQVSDVWIAGQHVVQMRQLAQSLGDATEDAVMHATAAWQNRTWQWLQR